MASPERPSRHGNAVADGPPRPFNSLAATNHLRSCAPRSRVEGWRGQGTKSVALRLVCVWRDRGGKPRAVPSPPRRRASPPPLRSLRASVVLSGYQPRRPNPHFRLTARCDARRFSSDPSRPDSCVDASYLVLEHEPCHELELAGAARRPLALVVPWTTRRRVGRRPAEWRRRTTRARRDPDPIGPPRALGNQVVTQKKVTS